MKKLSLILLILALSGQVWGQDKGQNNMYAPVALSVQEDKDPIPLIYEIDSFRKETIALIEEMARKYPEQDFSYLLEGEMKTTDLVKSSDVFIAKLLIEHSIRPDLSPLTISGEEREQILAGFPPELGQWAYQKAEEEFAKAPILKEEDREAIVDQLNRSEELVNRVNTDFYYPQIKTFYQDVKRKVRLEDEKAPVEILYFWASWCGPCHITLPKLVEVRKQYGPDQVTIVTVNVDGESQGTMIKKIKEKFSLNYPVFPGQRGDGRGIIIWPVPYTVIFNQGEIIEASSVFISDLNGVIDSLIDGTDNQ